MRPERDRQSADVLKPSLNLAYFLESKVSIFADIVLTLKQEVWRRGIVWIPRFAVKCRDCGTEYQEKKQICDCGSINMQEPNRAQLSLFKCLDGKRFDGKSFLESANQNEQGMETVGEEATRHGIVADTMYILCIKNYKYIQDLSGQEKLISTPLEFITLDPREVTPLQQKNGLFGGLIWTCVLHREIADAKLGTCRICGRELQEAHYEVEGARGGKIYYLKDEIIQTSIYYPSIFGGYPPILRLIYDAYAYHYAELRTYNYHCKGRPPGILVFPSNNLDSLNAQIKVMKENAREDPDDVQVVGYEPGQGKGVAQFITLMKDPGPDLLEVKKDLRERMGSMFGVSLVFQADVSASGGLNNEGLQITVTNRAVEFLQKPWNGRKENNYKGGIWYWIVSQFGITDWVLQNLPSEEQDQMAEKQREGQDILNAKSMWEMGFNVSYENGKFTYGGQAKPKPEALVMPALQPQPASEQQPKERVSGTPPDVHKSEPDELAEYRGDELIKSFAADALRAIRQGALYSFYQDVPMEAIPEIHAIIKDQFLQHRLSLKEMVEQIMERTGLDETKARMIARTESTAVAMKAREIGWRRMEQEREEEFKYKAVITNDDRTSPISRRIAAAVDVEGGAVSLDRLKEIYREESTKPYIPGDRENSGMGADWTGWENFVGHPYERDSIVRVVEPFAKSRINR